MSLRVRTNIQSLSAQRYFGLSSKAIEKHTERLSSGYRINRAADDAAGLAIAENIRADVRSLNQSQRNANDAISLIQVAEGSLNEVTNIIIRLRELATQSASDTITNKERGYINKEFLSLKDEIDRIAVSTEFNGKRPLIGGYDYMSDHYAELFPEPVDGVFDIQIDKDYNAAIDSESDTPINILKIDFNKINVMTDGENSLEIGSSSNEEGTRVDTKEEAQQSITVLSEAIDKVSTYRSEIGAIQNRLESTSRNLGIRLENLSSARSRIIDTDFASETALLTQSSILQQAGVSVLTQANQIPAIALQLLSA